MKPKFKLDAIRLDSFVTNLSKQSQKTAQGGATLKDGGCITIVTRGIWTNCCGDSNPTVC